MNDAAVAAYGLRVLAVGAWYAVVRVGRVRLSWRQALLLGLAVLVQAALYGAAEGIERAGDDKEEGR